MKSLSELILEEFSPSTLEAIISFGKYKVRGFRVGGPKSSAKTNIIKNTLLKDKKLIKVLQDYADDQTKKQCIDSTWTIVNEIDPDVLSKKIELNKMQNVVLELLSNGKVDIVEAILKESDVVKVEEAINEKPQEYKIEVDSLRSIIKKLEDEKRDFQKAKDKAQAKTNELNKALLSAKKETLEFKDKTEKIRKTVKEHEIRHIKEQSTIKSAVTFVSVNIISRSSFVTSIIPKGVR